MTELAARVLMNEKKRCKYLTREERHEHWKIRQEIARERKRKRRSEMARLKNLLESQ